MDCLWALCRIWQSWTAIADNHHVGIIVVFIIHEDLEEVLCRVRRWCMMVNCLMVFGAMMVLDVVPTLGGVAGTTLGDVGLGGGALGWPDIMVVSFRMTLRCFSLAVVVVGIAHPSCCNSSAAASKVTLCSDVIGTWQWLGYKRHVLEKRKRRVAGM